VARNGVSAPITAAVEDTPACAPGWWIRDDALRKAIEAGAGERLNLVWVRLKGYPWWPAQRLPPSAHDKVPPGCRKPSAAGAPCDAYQYFGTGDYQWISRNKAKVQYVDWATGWTQGYWAVSKRKPHMRGIGEACEVIKDPKDVPEIWFNYPESESESESESEEEVEEEKVKVRVRVRPATPKIPKPATKPSAGGVSALNPKAATPGRAGTPKAVLGKAVATATGGTPATGTPRRTCLRGCMGLVEMSDRRVHARVKGKVYCARSDGDFRAWMRGCFPCDADVEGRNWVARMVSERPELRWGKDVPPVKGLPNFNARKRGAAPSGGRGGRKKETAGAGPGAGEAFEDPDDQPPAKRPKLPTKAEAKAADKVAAEAAWAAAEAAMPQVRWPKLTSLTTYPLTAFRAPPEAAFELPFDVRSAGRPPPFELLRRCQWTHPPRLLPRDEVEACLCQPSPEAGPTNRVKSSRSDSITHL
jgi:hypothetical protein